MQPINHVSAKTRTLLQPYPVDPHERDAAGIEVIEVQEIALPTLNIRTLLLAVAGCFIFWYWLSWPLVTFLASLVVRWVE